MKRQTKLSNSRRKDARKVLRVTSLTPDVLLLIEGYGKLDRITRAELREVIARQIARQRNTIAWGAEAVRSEESESAAFDRALKELRHRTLRRRASQSTDKLQ